MVLRRSKRSSLAEKRAEYVLVLRLGLTDLGKVLRFVSLICKTFEIRVQEFTKPFEIWDMWAGGT